MVSKALHWRFIKKSSIFETGVVACNCYNVKSVQMGPCLLAYTNAQHKHNQTRIMHALGRAVSIVYCVCSLFDASLTQRVHTILFPLLGYERNKVDPCEWRSKNKLKQIEFRYCFPCLLVPTYQVRENRPLGRHTLLPQ